MKFEIMYDVSEKDIKQMIALDKECYFGADVGDFYKCLSWYKKCPQLYTVLKTNQEIVGYVNFLPITKASYDKIKKGQEKDYELQEKDILPFSKGNNYCLFMSVVIDKKYRLSKAIIVLLLGLKEKIKNFEADGIKIRSFVADCVTGEGEKLAKHFGGKFLCLTPSGSKIYEFENI